MTPTADSRDTPSVGRLLLVFALFTALGGPLAFVAWETVNQLLTGAVAGIRWHWFVPAVIGLGALLAILGRVLRR